MKAFIKTTFCLLLVISLIICTGCIKKEDTAPDREASVNNGTSIAVPEEVTNNDISAATGSEAVLTEQEKEHLWSYNYLDETEQKIFRKMLNMVRNLTVGWIDFGYLGNDSTGKVARAFRALSNDFPEYYWMPVFYYINVNNNRVSIAFKRNDMEDGYGFTKEQIEANSVEFSDAISRILKKTEKAQNDFEKEVIIHDALCKAVVYDSEYDYRDKNSVYSAYGALVNGHAVCEGYARAFKLLCRYAGIESILVTGNSRGVGHMWNMVNLENEWYHVDVTWDDLRQEPLHTYLNVTELYIRADHDIDINYSKADSSLASQGISFNFYLPKAESEKYNYYRQKGLVIADDPVSPCVSAIIDAYNNGFGKAELLFENNTTSKDFQNNYEVYIVEIQKRCIDEMGDVYFKLSTLSFPSKTCVIYFEEYESQKPTIWTSFIDKLSEFLGTK